MEVFQKLRLWMDSVKRSGPEAMAVDEWLLETAELPVLRVYQWDGDWASLGYFGKLADAQTKFAGVNWVRRWTGGGIVDHRTDWTYTLVVPKSETLATARGAESYRWIHAALVEALSGEQVVARVSNGEDETGALLCFENPVSYDIVSAEGRKIAGAGQRRTRDGLLHQGSLAIVTDENLSAKRAKTLASAVSCSWEFADLQPSSSILCTKTAVRYGMAAWLQKR